MKFCPCCGAEVIPGMKFCSECGYNLSSVKPVNKDDEKYKLILASCGYCEPAIVADILIDLFGYTRNRAKKLVEFAPVEIARNLTSKEARYSAQALAEYGAEVDILTSDNRYADMVPDNTARSIYNRDGSLVGEIRTILAGLDSDNRVVSYKQVKNQEMLDRPYKMQFSPKQPTHIRRFRPTTLSPFGFKPAMYTEPNPSLQRKTLKEEARKKENK